MNIIIDHTYLINLIDENARYHKHAECLSSILDNHTLYLTNTELFKTMDACKNLDKDTKIKIFNIINNITRNLNIPRPRYFDSILNIYTIYENLFTFSECLNLYYIKHRNIWKIVSFNSKYDQVKGLERIHNVGINDSIIEVTIEN